MNGKNVKENGSKKRIGITVVDVLILLFIVFVGFFAYKIIFTADTEEDTYAVSYVMKVNAVREELTDRIAVGDKVYLVGDNAAVGVVTAYEITGAVIEETGQTIPGMYDLYITIEAESQKDDGVYVSGYNIHVEDEYSMRTNSFAFDGVCISVGN